MRVIALSESCLSGPGSWLSPRPARGETRTRCHEMPRFDHVRRLVTRLCAPAPRAIHGTRGSRRRSGDPQTSAAAGDKPTFYTSYLKNRQPSPGRRSWLNACQAHIIPSGLALDSEPGARATGSRDNPAFVLGALNAVQTTKLDLKPRLQIFQRRSAKVLLAILFASCPHRSWVWTRRFFVLP